jgi:hypothetical protein
VEVPKCVSPRSGASIASPLLGTFRFTAKSEPVRPQQKVLWKSLVKCSVGAEERG